MPRIIRIGKSQENDFVINNPTVSRNHAMLTVADDNRHAILRDLGSKNGTYVNGVRIDKEMGIDLSHQLRFGSENTSLSSILNRTRVVIPPSNDPNSKIIGRGANCQIRLNHDDVSSRHAVLSKRSDGTIYIEDSGSRNGTFVNGERIMSRTLQRGDKVTITRNYPLDWESIFPVSVVQPPKPNIWRQIISVAAVVLILVCMGGGACWWWNNRSWDKERIYKEYHDAVCWVYVQYGYKVSVDGEDFTPTLCQLCKVTPSEIIHMEGDDLKAGAVGAQGTAFFITKDGKLATNLHITRPWLFSNDADELESGVNKILAILAATQNPLLSRSQVKVEGVIEGMYIVPDGLPVSDGNAIKVTEVKGYDDINKDVAIIQTETRELPSRVKNIIDIKNADTSEDCLTEGRTVFTIGFPYGAQIAMNSNQELKNQVHGGSITQNRGDYEFGHDAESAGGASGSPIINDKGRLIGIHHAGMTGVTGAQGFNMGIKVKYIIDLMN